MLDPTQVRECHIVKDLSRSMLACRLDPTGQSLAAGGMMPDVIQYALPRPAWDRPGRTVRLPGHKTWVAALAFAPDGKRLFTCDHSGMIQAWDFPARDAEQ